MFLNVHNIVVDVNVGCEGHIYEQVDNSPFSMHTHCTQIRTSSSCSSDRENDFGYLFYGFGIFCLEVQSAFDKNGKKNWPFFYPQGTFLAKKWGYKGDPGGLLAQMFP